MAPERSGQRWRHGQGEKGDADAGDGNRWSLQLGPLAFERRASSTPLWYARRSRRPRSWKIQLLQYGVILVAVLVALQLVGSQFRWLHLPHISFAGPTTTTITNVGPVIRDRLEGIPDPAPAVENYSFNFQMQRTKRYLGFVVLGYTDTYYVSGEAYSHVLLNPGQDYWKKNPNAFDLTVTRKPVTEATGSVRPGDISLAVRLPEPSLPRSVNDVRLDPASGSVPGAARWIGCLFGQRCAAAVLAHVYFTPQAEQTIAYEKLACDAGLDHRLAAIARQEAYSTVYGWLAKFSEALHYNLTLTISWTAQGSNDGQPLPRYCKVVNGSTVILPS